MLLLIIKVDVYASVNPVIELNFDNEYSEEVLKNSALIGKESKHVEGVIGNAFYLSSGCLTIDTLKLSNALDGTISIWLKPEWSYYQASEDYLVSHTFLSAKRKNGSYFVLSDGWWEKNGGGLFTYFIFDNLARSHIKSKIIFKKNIWTNLVISWSDKSQIIKMYQDGKLLTNKSVTFNKNNNFEKMYIGCDKASTLFDKRWLDASIDEVKVYDSMLSDHLVVSNYIEVSTKTGFNKEVKNSGKHYKSKLRNRVMFDSYPASWQTEEQALRTVKRLHDAGINVYMPCVWYGDGARFNSNVAPHAPYKGVGEPLKNLIRIAHKFNIEVHPWITLTYRSKNILPEYYEEGTPPKAFEVHNDKFRDFMVDFVSDLAQNYNIDGINLDYVRTIGVSKSKTSLDLFDKKYSKNLIKELRKLDKYHAWNAEVQEFINAPIDDMVSRISKRLRNYRPNAILSVDGYPLPMFMGESRQGRNELQWLNKGLIDVVYSMNYREELDIDRLDLVKDDALDPERVIILLGLLDRENTSKSINVSRSPDLVKKQVEFVGRRYGYGIGFYSYYYLSDDLHSLFKDSLFRDKLKATW